MSVVAVTKNNFETEVIRSDKPVLVDFWAAWCGPCRMVAPVVEEIAGEQDTVKVAKLNVDEGGEIAGAYGVMSIPTLMLFKNGKPAVQMVGAQSKDAILRMMRQ